MVVPKSSENKILEKILGKIPLEVTVELGRTERTIEDVEGLGVGKIITLDANVNEPVKLFVNGQYFAQGEIVPVKDENEEETYGVKIVSIVPEQERTDSLSEMIS